MGTIPEMEGVPSKSQMTSLRHVEVSPVIRPSHVGNLRRGTRRSQGNDTSVSGEVPRAGSSTVRSVPDYPSSKTDDNGSGSWSLLHRKGKLTGHRGRRDRVEEG